MDNHLARIARTLALFGLVFAMAATCGCSGGSSDVNVEPDIKATEPADILTAADVIDVTGQTKVAAVPLDLNPDAIYQVAFDRDGGERLAIFTIVHSEAVESLDPGGASVPVDIGDEGTATDTAVVFRVGARVGLLATFEQQYSDETRPAIDPEQLRELAGIAASRM